MKEQKLYICDYCNTQYSDKNECKQCETSHKTKLTIGKCRYLPYSIDKSGFPATVEIIDDKGNKRKYK